VNKKLHVSVTDSPVSVLHASTVQRASSLDHWARTTRCWNRMCSSMPFSRAVSWIYRQIESPSAMAFEPVHGRNE
jgi:hypothetical protein